jgi:hypothetical protein
MRAYRVTPRARMDRLTAASARSPSTPMTANRCKVVARNGLFRFIDGVFPMAPMP